MSFGDRLRELRLARERTQQQLADALGLSGAYISALEGGRKPAPPRMVVEQLARALGVDADDLWGTARTERELRLSLRVDGVPTSLRVEEPPSGGRATVEEGRVLQAIARHPELGQVVDALSAALDDPRTRAHATAAMQLLVRGLTPPSA